MTSGVTCRVKADSGVFMEEVKPSRGDQPHPKVLPPSQWSLFLTKLGHVPSVGPHKR